MSSFFTRSGDDGFTGRLGEGRLPKYHPITETIGSIDEASSALGLARAICLGQETAKILLQVQRDLYHIMAEIAATPETIIRFQSVDETNVTWLEEQINTFTQQFEMPGEFIIPGDNQSGASLALARTIVRRSERWVARLIHDKLLLNSHVLEYLNRLSSLCFTLELFEYSTTGKFPPSLAKNK